MLYQRVLVPCVIGISITSFSELDAFGNMSRLTAKKAVERLYRNRRDIHKEKRGNVQLWFLR